MKTDKKDYLSISHLNLPNHNSKLSKADEVIEMLKYKVNTAIMLNQLTDESHEELFEETMSVLVYIGDLSISAFDISDELEEFYKMKFIHAPVLGKTLWQEHYSKIHHPYTLRKNRCYTIIESLDEGYREKFGCNPPNWKI